MDKAIKIIIIGFGSIGKRHYDNLLKLGYKNVYVYDPDRDKIKKGIKFIEKLNSKTLSEFKIAFVLNPTSLHIETALKCAKSGCHLFIEKPFSNTLKNTEKLIKLCKKKNLITMVACNFRFDPCLKKIKELLDKKYLGKIYAIYLEYGRYLPYQRQGVDYKKVYAGKKKLGGGIILDDIHDFDLLFWFNNFKKTKALNFVFKKLSDLKIDVEDIANATFLFDNEVIGNVRCDYLQQYKHKDCKIIGEKGNLYWNFRENAVYFEFFDKKKKAERRKKIFQAASDFQSSYIDEIKYFLECVKKNKNTFNDLKRSLSVLKPVLENIKT